MDIRDRKQLKRSAAESLQEAAYSPKKLILLHTGIALSLSLIVTVINFILNRQIDATVGLSGIGLRSLLTTAQSVLSMANSILLPFWEFGIIFAAVAWARKQDAHPNSLTEGFRRFGPVLRLTLLKAIILFAVIMLCTQIAMLIFMVTPLSGNTLQIMESLPAEGITEEMLADEALLNSLMDSLLPMYLVLGGVLLAIILPVLYYLRMADYLIMDMEQPKALPALIASVRMMRYNCISLFKLDLSFWWYNALGLLSMALCYGDLWLPLLGISLPVNQDVALFLFYGIHVLFQLVLAWFAGSYIQTTYANAYEALLPEAGFPSQTDNSVENNTTE